MIKILLRYGSILFVVLNLIQALFVPSGMRFFWDELMLPVALVYSFLYVFRMRELKLFWILLSSLAGLLFFSSLLNGTAISGSWIGFSLRWVKYAAIFSVVLIECREMDRQESWKNFFHFIFVLYAGINVLILISGEWGSQLQLFFNGKRDVFLSNVYEFESFRLSGTQMNPNTNALLLGVFGLFFLFVDKIKYWKSIFLAFLLILLSQSRTVSVAFPIAAGVMLFFQSKKIKISIRTFVISGGILLLFLALTLINKNLYSLLTLKAFTSRSFLSRLENFELLSNLDSVEWFLGKGIVLNPIQNLGVHFDSEYLALIFQYGFLGLLLWLILHIASVFIGKSKGYRWTILGFVVYIFISSITNTVLLSSNFSILYFVILGVVLARRMESKSK